ncbi:ferric-chelate reductase 1-like [Penaeus monodon]|uniref:ferric-chelate reductase 1-like n=1 Tax=Penaeus monodon TaxID=6687 RepID=UPI0018A7115B|nr:ferric-chelate reductase 1-like [Penaeus monodon]
MIAEVTVGALLSILSNVALGFPDGAPIEACILPHANSPNHAGTKPMPHQTEHHQFTASSGTYTPGDLVEVTISGPPFKGFFVQAQDSHTGDWLGEFLDDGPVKTHPECSAITHADKARKKHIRLTWRAPRSGSGSVTFTGTVLERYDKYWSDMVAEVVSPHRRF